MRNGGVESVWRRWRVVLLAGDVCLGRFLHTYILMSDLAIDFGTVSSQACQGGTSHGRRSYRDP